MLNPYVSNPPFNPLQLETSKGGSWVDGKAVATPLPPAGFMPRDVVCYPYEVDSIVAAPHVKEGAEKLLLCSNCDFASAENLGHHLDFVEQYKDIRTNSEACQKANSAMDSDLMANIEEDAIFRMESPEGRTVEVFTSCVKGSCNCEFILEGVKSQLKPCRFASLIFANNDLTDKYSELFGYIVDGFPIVDSPVDTYECQHYLSITSSDVKPLMDIIIRKELSEGAISIVNDKPHCVHSLGAVPKSDGGIRPITDCSRPYNISVNNHCDDIIRDFCFKNVSTVTDLLGENDYMTVVDIKSAYRAVPIRPEHRKFQGFKWDLDGNSLWFVDNRMCFGLRLGPMYFNMLSTFVHDVMLNVYNVKIVNYLDDFIAVSENYKKCVHAQDSILKLLRHLGFYVSFSKLIHPSKCVVYLGIIIDSVRMELRLPEGKVSKLKCLLDQLLAKRRVSRKEIEKLGGLLSHCAHVVKGDKVFCKRVFNLYKTSINTNCKFIAMPDSVKADLRWWRNLIDNFNGTKKIINESMVSLVLRQYMRGENGTENLVGFFSCLAYSNRKT